MKIKICFNNETHRLTKVPETFQNLSELISSIFLSSLPTSWVLEYLDSEGDKIMLGDEQDYIEFMNSEVKTNLSGRAIKVFIVPKVPLTESQALERALVLERRLEEQNETSQSIEISEKSALESKPLSIEEPVKPVEEVQMEMIKPEEPVPVHVREEPVEVQEVKVAEMEKVVIDEKPKVAPKNVAQKRGGKGKKQFTKTVVSQVKVGVQNLDDMVNKAVEKNIEKIAMMTQSFLSQSSVKAQVEEQTQTQAQIPQPVHDEVECNGCGMCPIVGVRYKCTVNPDFDFCERCEQSKEHPYAFIKIKFPGQVYSNEQQQQQKMVDEVQPEEEIVEEKIAVVEEVKEEKTQEKPEPHEISEVVVPTTKPEVKQSWFRWPRVQAPTYSRQVMNKAQQLKELLPEVNIDSLLSFVSNAPEDLDLVELLENFKY